MNSFAVIPAVAILVIGQVPASVHAGPTLDEIRTRLGAYERQTAETGRLEPAPLGEIANAVIAQARRSTTFPVWSEACGSTAVPESDDCDARLWAIVKGTRESLTTRANAASALMSKGDATAAEALAGLLKTAPASTLVQFTPIVEKMPAKQAVPILVRLAESTASDEQQKACEALSGFDVTESRAAITKIVDANAPGTPPWLACMIARARLHEITTPGAVAGYGHTLQGAGQLFAAKVMIETGNDAAVQLLTDLTHRGNARERLAAADTLIDMQPDAAIPAVDVALGSSDAGVRAAALLSEQRLKRSPSRLVRSMLVDADGIVRVRAAEDVIEWVKRSQNR